MFSSLFMYWLLLHKIKHISDDLCYHGELVASEIKLDQLATLYENYPETSFHEYSRLQQQITSATRGEDASSYIFILVQDQGGKTIPILESTDADRAIREYVHKNYFGIPAGELSVFSNKTTFVSDPAIKNNFAWVDVLVPIVEPESKDLVAVFGVLYYVSDWQERAVRTVLPAFILMVVAVVLLLLGTFVIFRKNHEPDTSKASSQEKVFVVAVLGVFLSSLIAWIAHERPESDARYRAFQQLANDKTTAISRALHSLQNVELEALARFYESSEFVSTKEFSGYTDYLLKNPAIASWQWIMPVSGNDKKRVESEIQNREYNTFTIWNSGNEPSSGALTASDTLYPVVRVAPFTQNRDMLGFNLASDPLFRVPLAEAVNSSLPTCTKPSAFLHGECKDKTFQVFRPVYTRNGQKHLRGFASAVVRLEELVYGAQSTSAIHVDLEYPNPETDVLEVIASKDYSTHADYSLEITLPVFVFGTTLFVSTHAGPAFMQLHPVQMGWLVAIVGLLLTFTLVIISSMVYRKREKLETLVAERTAELQEAKQSAELAIYGANLATWDWDIVKNEVVFNENWAKMIGDTDGRLKYTEREWYALLSENYNSPSQEAALRYLRQVESIDLEQRVTHKDGHAVWLLARGRVVRRASDGTPQRACGTYLDITNRKNMEAALQRSEAFLRVLIKSIPDLVWLKDPDGVYMAANSKFERLYNSTEAEIIGENRR